MLILLAQALGAYSIGRVAAVIVVIATILYILNNVDQIPAKGKMVLNAVGVAIMIILAIQLLSSFV